VISGTSILSRKPVELLLGLQQLYVHEQQGESASTDAPKVLAFEVAKYSLCCEMNQIDSVADPAALLVLPNTKPWLRGVINRHGRNLSVVDLALFLELGGPVAEGTGQLLVLAESSLQVSFWVDSVIGLRSFADTDLVAATDALPSGLSGYSGQTYVDGKRVWNLLDISAITSSARFHEVQ
jgi:chemotaxis signal transduction protein